VYADGVLNLANAPNTVKFYLYRLDAHLKGGLNSQVQPFAQIVMPVNGFVSTVVFFDRMLEKLVQEGAVSRKMIDDMRAIEGKPTADQQS
jgi:hypothetical protein